MNAEKTPPQGSSINIGPVDSLVNVSEVYFNVAQEVIVTTEDKLRLALAKHLKSMERKRGWITPFGFTFSLTMTLMTATFKDAGFDAATWRAVFIVGDVVAFIWLITSIKDAVRSAKMEDVIVELKKGSRPAPKPPAGVD